MANSEGLLKLRQGLIDEIRLLDGMLQDEGVQLPKEIPYIQPVSEAKQELAKAIGDLSTMVTKGTISEHRFLECIEAWAAVWRTVHNESPIRAEDIVKLARGSRS